MCKTFFPPQVCLPSARLATTAVAIALLFHGPEALAQRHAAVPYGAADGLPAPKVLSLAQDEEGYVWAGTTAGLARFDGSAFRVFTTADGLPGNRVGALASLPGGGVVVGTSDDVMLFAPRSALSAPAGQGDRRVAEAAASAGGDEAAPDGGSRDLSDSARDASTYWTDGFGWSGVGRVDALVVSDSATDEPGGEVWAATSTGLWHLTADGARLLGGADGVPSDPARSLLLDTAGRLWVGSSAGLAVLDRSASRLRQIEMSRSDRAAQSPVVALVEDDAGVIWAGSAGGLARLSPGGDRLEPIQAREWGGELLGAAERPPVVGAAVRQSDGSLWLATSQGVVRRHRGRFESVELVGVPGQTSSLANALLVDLEDNIWVATDEGMVHLTRRDFAHFTLADGLPHPSVIDVAEDSAGAIWISTPGGVRRLTASPHQVGFDVGTVPGLEGTTADSAAAQPTTVLLGRPDGSMLLGTERGLVRRRSGRLRQRWGVADGLPSEKVTALAAASGDDVWVGTSAGLALLSAGRLTKPSGSEDLDGVRIADLVVDSRQRLWVATKARGIFRQNGSHFSSIEDDSELESTTVWSLAAGDDGSVWAATNGLGALRFSSTGEIVRLTRALSGLANDFVHQVVVGSRGRVWLFTNRGLDRWDPQVGLTHFDLQDGLGDSAGNPAAGLRDSSGGLWFGTPRGLALFQGDQSGPSVSAAPKVLVRAVFVDGEMAAWRPGDDALKLSPDVNDVRVEFGALSFRDQESMRYSYRLLGRSERWSSPSREVGVSFAGLAPGDYTLQVQAISPDGIWSAVPAEVSFESSPALHETAWFRGLGVLLALGLVAAWVARRVRSVEEERLRLREMVDRRTRELVEKNALLERMATTDELTNLPNRRFFMENLERELRRMSRLGASGVLSVLVIDLDNFKLINDRLGHAAGDEALRRIAARLAYGVRASDLAARYGGEEFAIMLPNTGVNGASLLAEKIRADVERTRLQLNGARAQVTISVGVAAVGTPERYSKELHEDLVRRADEAMYAAKTSGKNRYCVDERSRRVTAPVLQPSDQPASS